MRRSALALWALPLFIPSIASADVFSLASLLKTTTTDPSIQVGDKIFSDFTYSPSGDMPAASLVNVVTQNPAPNGLIGLLFTGPFQDKVGGGASDAALSYKVTIASGSAFSILGADLDTVMSVVGPGATGSVTDGFIFNQPPILGTIVTHGTSNSASVIFSDEYKTLQVQKDILLDAGNDASGIATVSMIYQTYVQVPDVGAPEPASLALLGLGALGLLTRRRRA